MRLYNVIKMSRTFILTQSPPVEAALLSPDTAAVQIDPILSSTAAAHLIQGWTSEDRLVHTTNEQVSPHDQ